MDKLDNFMVKSISYNVILQVSFRIFTFVLNALLFRNVNTDLIGACNLHLALLYTTILFLSREPFRRALPGFKTFEGNNERLQNFTNTLWLVLPNGILVSLVFGYLWSHVFSQPDETSVAYYSQAVYLTCVACVLELFSEITFALSQMLFLAKLKVLLEASNLFIFNLIFVYLAIFHPRLGALSYAIARLVNVILLVSSNYYFLLKHKPENLKHLNFKSLMPNLSNYKVDGEYLNLAKAYYVQSIFKQLLSEGERYLITVFGLLTFAESGIYDIINNLGSLIARFIFLPVEDASYVYFTNSFKRGVVFKHQSEATSRKGKNYFESMLKLMSLIGLLVFVYGQSYSRLLLQLYGGDHLGKNDVSVNLLRFHCAYIYFLSLNGLTEGFFNATMSEQQLKSYNNRLILFSVTFLSIAFVCAKIFHVYGFLMANCVNMLVRIVYSTAHINTFFQGYEYKNENVVSDQQHYDYYRIYFPEVKLMAFLLAAFSLTKFSEFKIYPQSAVIHLFIGAFIFLLNLLFILKQENNLRDFAVTTFKKTLKLS